MATRVPVLSVDDQEYYPLHEEDDVPETPPHEAAVRYARDGIAASFPDWFVTGNACVYWERGNTKEYRAPDLFVVKEPLTEPVRPLRTPATVTAVVLLAAGGVLAVGLFPSLFAHFPPLSTLLGR